MAERIHCAEKLVLDSRPPKAESCDEAEGVGGRLNNLCNLCILLPGFRCSLKVRDKLINFVLSRGGGEGLQT